MEWLTDFLEYTIIHIGGFHLKLYHIFVLAVIYLGVRILARSIELFINKKVGQRYELEEGKKFAIIKLFKYFLYTTAFIFGLEVLGFNLSLLLAGSAALLVGVGLGIQDVFRDLVSGLILLFEGSLKVGDVVEIDTLVGVVKEINMRTSKVRTRDGIIIIVPNSYLISQKVINWSNSNKLTRFRIQVGVSYNSDVDKVRDILIQCAREHESVAQRPKPFARFTDFGESALIFELFFWSERIWRIEDTRSDLRFMIKKSFRENGIHIPYPQRDLHIRREDLGLPENEDRISPIGE